MGRNNPPVSWGFCQKRYIVNGGRFFCPGYNLSVLCLFSEVSLTWLTQMHSCMDQLLTTVICFHKLEPLVSYCIHTLTCHILVWCHHQFPSHLSYYCYISQNNLGASYLIVTQLLSQGKQADISSGQSKRKQVLRDSTTRSIQSLRLFTSNDKTSYFLGYRKATLWQSCCAVYWSVHEIGFQGKQKIWPHWLLLPLFPSTAKRVTSLGGNTTQLHDLILHRNISATVKAFVIF